tara:strand:+ start:163 stop:489 length:327 start_codon:yes stop_codon:yes gene_type:complete
MSKFTIKIGDDNSVNIFEKGTQAPVIHQPTWPNGFHFKTKEEALLWGNLALKRLNGYDGDEVPGYGPKKPVRLKSELAEEQDLAVEEIQVELSLTDPEAPAAEEDAVK